MSNIIRKEIARHERLIDVTRKVLEAEPTLPEERGYLIGRLADHYGRICALEVELEDWYDQDEEHPDPEPHQRRFPVGV